MTNGEALKLLTRIVFYFASCAYLLYALWQGSLLGVGIGLVACNTSRP